MNDQSKTRVIISKIESDYTDTTHQYLSNYEVVFASIHRIMNLTKQNYTDKQILEIFTKAGIQMKLETFVRYYKRAAAEVGSPLRRKRGRRRLNPN